MKKILLARVGYMKFYRGPKPGDERPIGGGKYNNDDIGHEAYNFLNINGKLYGYFQPHMTKPYEIDLGRIEQNFYGEKIDDVLVVWFATVKRGQIVIGWYKDATVFKSIQSSNELMDRDNYNYNVIAETKNCTLLPISNRTYPVGHNIPNTKKVILGRLMYFIYLMKKDLRKTYLNLITHG